ncbi:beta and beta-prime subunits of DNA dependent RNA-polymerase [Eremomyces bilateralis CBS 781.70]|uniref:DNA-directed RNA polymerase subunit beta n=1 Tax=Eremomyces bilateralis CBS 781.70 TaxID=1392243 RepID=A0A6G1GDX5_9PEZI|nr:beta and beta-prime subunits of DNA dependent RNA-polymerase [Eremomyces bilateralis CBS 781.70]KAF1816297.1 beta and beta-prime subunits of DNA dependent RNA-polymerase [Eremomyces bilateralis CBS 781.70]
MAPSANGKQMTVTARPKPSSKWTTNFDTVKREKLFRSPPEKTAYPSLAEAIAPHVDSFNAAFEEHGLLEHAVADIGTKVFVDGPLDQVLRRNHLHVRIGEVFLEKPQLPPTNKTSPRREILPSECRQRHATYKGRLRARLQYRVNDGDWEEVTRDLGSLPIMLRTKKCHLDGFGPAELVQAKEETEELGGYFIVNGNERMIRLLIQNRRNYPMAITRPSFKNRGLLYTDHGIQIRSTRPDQTSVTNVLHFLSDGNVMMRFSWRKSEYLVPVMMVMNALVDTNDREIFEGVVGPAGSKGLEDKQFVLDRAEFLVRAYKAYELQGKHQARAFLGSRFKVILQLPEDVDDDAAGIEFLRRIVLPHLGSLNVTESQNRDKLRLLIFMVRKLYAFVGGECAADDPDRATMQEVLLPGFLYSMILKERLEEWLNSLRPLIREWGQSHGFAPFTSEDFRKDFLPKIVRKTTENLGGLLDYFLSTGNLSSPSGLDLQQASGFTIVAEKINFYRFISHFRMVHRGSFFAELKTTTVRKLLPESWGFLCPIHTPDGSPCGLLNHLAHKCKIATKSLPVSNIPGLIAQFGLKSTSSTSLEDSVVVLMDGKILGFCSPQQAKAVHDSLRHWKVTGMHDIPRELEIGYVPNTTGGQYPGVYISSQPQRMYRPVKYLPVNGLDYIGTFEQPYMNIACTEPEISGQSSHVEYDPTNVLSIVANMTPFSDFNQSPRNMYQCQMGKQTMGTPSTSLRYRGDNKMYLLQTGQTPIVRPPLHNEYGFDNFPNGTNAVVAVISYTGYDMDDAMIINKSAHERGFGYGTIYKTKKVDLAENKGKGNTKRIDKVFGFAPEGVVLNSWRTTLDEDGLPMIGALIHEGDALCATYTVSHDPETNTYRSRDHTTEVHRYKESESGFIDAVKVLLPESGEGPPQAISVTIRIPRAPIIGDKFSSRHGQKGVCSQKFPAIDLPFSESGMQPDVIINPHAFPSRMTIGMFVESLAGKAGALHGFAQDSTPWRFDEQDRAVEYFGDQLRAAGYNYYGNEPMYSGITGEELHADIYVGLVYYQRLRHMVSDKYQVRATGINDPVTGQPVQGRARGGGIRVGEMERDSLLAHGTAFLLQDRLLNCSDYTKAWICKACGHFLGVSPTVDGWGQGGGKGTQIVRCRYCAKKVEGRVAKAEVWEDGEGTLMTGGTDVRVLAVPGVLKYLDVELMSMGVKMKFKVGP